MRKKTCCEVTQYLQYKYPEKDSYCGYICFDERMDYKKAVEMIDNGDYDLDILIER